MASEAKLAISCGCGAALDAVASYHSDLKQTRDMWERMHGTHYPPVEPTASSDALGEDASG